MWLLGVLGALFCVLVGMFLQDVVTTVQEKSKDKKKAAKVERDYLHARLTHIHDDVHSIYKIVKKKELQ